MSKLIVEVCKVEKIEKHPNADRLSIVTVKGWHCIVSLDQYKEGDLVIYCPPDSVIPNDIIEKYNLEFLKKNGKVGTIKLRKYISQGLILDIPYGSSWKEGLDVALMMGITKYEISEPKYQQFKDKETIYKTFLKYKSKKITFRRLIFKCIGIVRDKFKKKKNINPLFSKYTDIDNIKNYKNIFKDGDLVVITEKIHGTNFRAGYVPKNHKRGLYKFFKKRKSQEFCYGSHRVQLEGNRGKQCWYGEDIYGQISERYKLAEIIPTDYILYGEIYGKGIQDLEYGKEDIDVVFFDVKYKGNYLNWSSFVVFCNTYQLPIVPILASEFFSEKYTISTYTNGKSKLYPKHLREGCVIKSQSEINHPKIGRKVLKSVSDEYLLRKGGTEYK